MKSPFDSCRAFIITIIIALSFGITGCDDASYVHTEIDGVAYSIPKIFDFASAPPARYTDSIIISVTYPLFTPPPTYEAMIQARVNFKDNVTILTTTTKKTKTLDEIIEIQTDFYKASRTKEVQFGLIRFAQPSEHNGARGDLWVEDAQDKPESFIQCSPKDEGAHPRCDMRFVYSGLLYTVSFEISHLQDWKEIKNKSIKLFDSFKVNSKRSMPDSRT